MDIVSIQVSRHVQPDGSVQKVKETTYGNRTKRRTATAMKSDNSKRTSTNRSQVSSSHTTGTARSSGTGPLTRKTILKRSLSQQRQHAMEYDSASTEYDDYHDLLPLLNKHHYWTATATSSSMSLPQSTPASCGWYVLRKGCLCSVIVVLLLLALWFLVSLLPMEEGNSGWLSIQDGITHWLQHYWPSSLE